MAEFDTFDAALNASVERHPAKVAFFINDEPITFAELDQRANAAAHVLVGLGVCPGDTIALFTETSAEWIEIWLAAARIGAVSMPVNTMFKGDFLRHQLHDSRARVVLVDVGLLDRIQAVADELPHLRHVVVRGEVPSVETSGSIQLLSAEALRDGSMLPVVDAVPLAGTVPATLMYTSGTTGPSKGVMITQNYLLAAARAVIGAGGYSGDDVLYGAVPLFHGSGLLGLVLPTLLTGCTSVLDTQFSVSGTWDRVRKHQATIVLAVGPMLVMLWGLPPDPGDAALPVRVMLAAPIPAALHLPIEERYACKLTTIYGLTEAQPMTVQSVTDPAMPGSAGKASPSFDVRIFDDEDNELPRGEVGEIVCRPLAPHVMFEGYLNRPEDTLRQFKNLWFHTGDAGRLDENGNLFFVDRRKDSIRRRGENISSVEVEMSLARHPAVAESAAHPVPSDLGEDDVKICVVLKEGHALSEIEMMEFCVDRLPYFALPRYIEFVTSLPKNAVGRVQKFKLREVGVTSSTWDREAAGFVVKR
jgi:crotonobetaine/carnitine-CoA ligase